MPEKIWYAIRQRVRRENGEARIDLRVEKFIGSRLASVETHENLTLAEVKAKTAAFVSDEGEL